jgi:hypothetical protein
MKVILPVAREQQGLIEIIFKQGERMTSSRLACQTCITYKLPTAGKQLFFRQLKDGRIGIKIGMQRFSPGNISIYIKTRHAV